MKMDNAGKWTLDWDMWIQIELGYMDLDLSTETYE